MKRVLSLLVLLAATCVQAQHVVQYWNSVEVVNSAGIMPDDGNRVGVVYARAYLRSERPELERTTARFIMGGGCVTTQPCTSKPASKWDWSNYDEAYAFARQIDAIPLFRLNLMVTPLHPRTAPDDFDFTSWKIDRGIGDEEGPNAVDPFSPKNRTLIRQLWAEGVKRYPAARWDVAYPGGSGEPTGAIEWWEHYERDEWLGAQMWATKTIIDLAGADRVVVNLGAYTATLVYAYNRGVRAFRDDSFGGDERHAKIAKQRASSSVGPLIRNGLAFWETFYDMERWPGPGMTGDIARVLRDGADWPAAAFLGNMGSAIPARHRQVVRDHFFARAKPLPASWQNVWESAGSIDDPIDDPDPPEPVDVIMTLSDASYAAGVRLAGFTTQALEADELESGRAFDPEEFPFFASDRTTTRLPAGVHRVWYRLPAGFRVVSADEVFVADETIYAGYARPETSTTLTVSLEPAGESSAETIRRLTEQVQEQQAAINALQERILRAATAAQEASRILSGGE
ncbi:MAG: hypothetical protein AAGI08_00155 [Bacteroidota bacterium]